MHSVESWDTTGASGPVDFAHSARAQPGAQHVWSEAPAHERRGVAPPLAGECKGRGTEERRSAIVGQKRLDLTPQLAIVPTCITQERGTLIRTALQRGVIEPLDR